MKGLGAISVHVCFRDSVMVLGLYLVIDVLLRYTYTVMSSTKLL